MMNTKQAKDFLVQQTAEQADLENIPLSDIEKKMMYFTEDDDASCGDPIGLNEEFEAQYDTAEYEAKISRLLHHARARLKEEDPQRVRDWDQSFRTLRKGDHYILVLWGATPASDHPVRDYLKPIGLGMLLAPVLAILFILAAKYNITLDRLHWDRVRRYLPSPNPRLALILYLLIVLLAVGWSRRFQRGLVAKLRRKTKKGKELE